MIKSFKLFESNSFSYDDCMDLIDDIKSLEYIIDEAGDYYKVSYNIVFSVDDIYNKIQQHKIALLPNSAKSWIDNCNRTGVEFGYEGIKIEISYDLNKLLSVSVGKIKDCSLDKLNDLCRRYCLLLGEHLDYVGSPVKNVRKLDINLSTPSNKRCFIKIEL
jgi:hypothetical protein